MVASMFPFFFHDWHLYTQDSANTATVATGTVALLVPIVASSCEPLAKFTVSGIVGRFAWVSHLFFSKSVVHFVNVLSIL
jgi:hypothetical protein